MEVEVEGRTTEDAIEAACRQLGLPREAVEIQIVTPGSTGIFGFVGARKAKVRARPRGEHPPEGERAAAEQPERQPSAARPPRGRRPEGERTEAEQPEGQPSEARPARGRRPRGRRRPEAKRPEMAAPEGEAEAQAEAMEAAPEAEKPAPAREEGERRPSRGRRRRGHRGRGKAAQAEEAPAEEAAAHALEEEEETPVSAAQPAPEPEPLPPASEELVAAAKEACQAIVAAMGYEGVEVRAESLPGEARLELIGEECPALIGHRGDILDALQHIVSKMANRQAGTRTSIVVDTEGWRAQRQGNLEELAVSLARKVKETGKPAAMSPMNAHDRRIVHLLLENDTDLRTKSAGDGPMRKVVIFPRRGRRRKKAPAASEE